MEWYWWAILYLVVGSMLSGVVAWVTNNDDPLVRLNVTFSYPIVLVIVIFMGLSDLVTTGLKKWKS